MSPAAAVLGWLEDRSDWLSPIVVKEVRQIVRSREFSFSFAVSLVAALAVAFYGAADATRGNGTSGSGTFMALMVCLTLLGMLVVPIGAFSALRAERMEQTLELVTLTALSPRRIIIGKLMAQAVKLLTLFAAMAPFMTMSFLLGGIDFFTILLSLLVLFAWSLWACAAFVFLSTLFQSRAMSGVVFGAAGILLLVVLSLGRVSFFVVRGVSPFPGSPTGRTVFWWALTMIMTGCAATMVNLVLLAENRLAAPIENRVTALRFGFLAQFLLIVGWMLSYWGQLPTTLDTAARGFGALAGVHLALVAMFTVTEGLRLPRRALLQMEKARRWAWALALFGPGGGRGAAYVLVQMALLVGAGVILSPSAETMRWLLALCGYICCFSGVPALAMRMARPRADRTFILRVGVLMLFALALVLPDLLYNVIWQPAAFDVAFARRHLVNPVRTLANWSVVEQYGWGFVPYAIGLTGLVAYAGLIALGARVTAEERGVTPLD